MDKMLTEQEVFDTVRTKMKEQGEPSFEGNACRMRTTDGLSCAYGCLLTDQEVHRAPARPTTASAPARLAGCVSLLQELQKAHDNAAYERRYDGMDSPTWHERFEASMVKIANRYNLELKSL